jgi:hypothetical protein
MFLLFLPSLLQKYEGNFLTWERENRELICVTIGPVFLTAAIYLCLSRIIVVYGIHLSRLIPGTIAISFMVSDFISLLLQAGGGAVVEIANDFTVERIGIHLTIAGLSLQVASLGVLLVGCVDFVRRCRGKGRVLSGVESHKRIRGAILFEVFLGGKLMDAWGMTEDLLT